MKLKKNETVTFHFELYQLITESKNTLENSPSRINLIFTSQPNLVVNSAVNILFTLTKLQTSNFVCKV